MRTNRLGRTICADPSVCHGQQTFEGTRILVSDVLELLATGMNWDHIIKECHGGISRSAIAGRFAVLAGHGPACRRVPEGRSERACSGRERLPESADTTLVPA